MSDRNIDIDLIMALAEDSLPPDEAELAEAALDEASRAELALQREALAAFARTEPVELTADERSVLHAAIRAEINMPPRPEPQPSTAPVRQPWYVRALPALGAAAALVVVVGVGINSIGGDDADQGQVASEAADLAEESGAVTNRTQADDAASLLGDTTAAQTEATAAATSATTAAATESLDAPAAGSDAENEPDDLGEISAEDLLGLAERTFNASRFEATLPFDVDLLPETASQKGLACWIELGESQLGVVEYIGVATFDGQPAEIYRIGDTEGNFVISIFAADDCTPLAQILP